MIFTEVRFVLLFVGCWMTFFAAPHRFRSAVLTIWGAAFYAVYAPAYVPLVLELIVAAYLIGRQRGDLLLVLLVSALFVTFKTGADVLGLSHLRPPSTGIAAIIVPLGFSFLAFELLHFAIECHRGRIERPALLDVASFALYFPCRVAGPIKRYGAYQSAVAAAVPTAANVYAGFVRVLIGVAKKVVLADFFALTAAEVMYAATPLHVWKVVLAYSLQIYLDFSAYSDIAIGFSRMLGITVPENFNWPYFSSNIQEFWNRWHMTLSGWARDYVFTPSGRALFKTALRTHPAAIATLSYLATFLVIGAWHGLTASFLVWGAYHALLVTVYYLYRRHVPAALTTSAWFDSTLTTVASIGLTFLLVTIGWVPFMTTLPNATRLLRIMAGGH